MKFWSDPFPSMKDLFKKERCRQCGSVVDVDMRGYLAPHNVKVSHGWFRCSGSGVLVGFGLNSEVRCGEKI